MKNNLTLVAGLERLDLATFRRIWMHMCRTLITPMVTNPRSAATAASTMRCLRSSATVRIRLPLKEYNSKTNLSGPRSRDMLEKANEMLDLQALYRRR